MSDTQVKATPRFERHKTNGHCIHDHGTGALLFVHALMDGNVEKTMSAVIRAVNSHDKLISVVRKYLANMCGSDELRVEAEAAIQSAEEQPK